MRSIKKVAALILSIAMICSFAMPAFAQDTVPEPPPASSTSQGESVTPPEASTVPEPPPASSTEQGESVTPPEADTVPEEEAPALPNVVGFSIQRAPAPTHFFSIFMRGTPTKEITGTHTIDALNMDSKESRDLRTFAIYDKSNPNSSSIFLDVNNFKQDPEGMLIVEAANQAMGATTYNAFMITPQKKGSCILTYTDDTIADRPLNLTLNLNLINVPPNEIYDITTGAVIPHNSTRKITYDGSSFNTKTFEVILEDKYGDPTPNLSDYSFNGRKLTDSESNIDGVLSMRFSPQNNNGTGKLTFTALANIPPNAKIRIELTKGTESYVFFIAAEGFATDEVMQIGEGTVNAPGGNLTSRRYNFAVTKDGNWSKNFHFALGSASNPYRLDANKVTYTIETKGSDGHDTKFSVANDPQGNAKLHFDYSQAGSYQLRFNVTYEGKTYSTDWVYCNVDPAQKQTILNVPSTEYPTITAALAAFTTDLLNKTECIIQLADDTVFDKEPNGVLEFNRPKVLIRGAGHGSVILANVKLNAGAGGVQYMEDLTIAGSTGDARKAGAGVTNFSGKCRGGGVLIKNFAIGMDMKDDVIPLGADVENCGIGVNQYVYPALNSLTINMYRTYRNNDIAVQIQPGGNPNPFAMAFYYCNFIGNGKNVVNPTAVDYNFSFNYYDNVDAARFEGVTASPYYKERVNTTTRDVPTNLYVSDSELAKGFAVSRDRLGSTSQLNTANFGSTPVELNLVDVDNDGGATTETASWSFAANGTNGSTFNPAIATELKDSSSNAAATLPSGATYQPVSFAHSGALPGAATVNVVKDATAPESNLKLYKVVGNSLVLQPEAVAFNNGKYEFVRDSASDYIITDALSATTITTALTAHLAAPMIMLALMKSTTS